jgi:uncharacterized protein YqhQ/glutaredoxin
MVRRRHALSLVLAAPLALLARAASALPSSSNGAVTIYGASWCGPCKILERGLKERDIPFEIIDVDQSPESFARAKQATGSSSIPQTCVARGADTTWIIGADVDAVEKAYRGLAPAPARGSLEFPPICTTLSAMSDLPAPARPYIGGQALLEGVMMRSPHSFAIVCRRKSGELVVRERPIVDERKGARALPLIRGIMTLVESLKLGSEAMRFSADLYEKDLEAEDAAEEARKKSLASRASSMLSALSLPIIALASLPADHEPAPDVPKDKSRFGQFLVIGFALALFIAAPQAAANGINKVANLGLDIRSAGFAAITGAMKLTIVIGYMALIRRVPDIRRVFQYHGAEHKTISTYEAEEELVVENARAKTTLHPRCGTTFLVMVAMVSVLVFAAIGPMLPRIGALGGLGENVGLFLMKLPFIPVIAGITYEIQRVFARYCTTGPLRALLWPGFLVQKITTIEPDDDQLEVALASLRATLWREAGVTQAPDTVTQRTFPSYQALATDTGYAKA